MLIYCYFKFLFFLSFSPWISIRICGGGGVGAPFPSCCLKEVFVIIMSIGDRLLLDNMTLRLAKLIFFRLREMFWRLFKNKVEKELKPNPAPR